MNTPGSFQEQLLAELKETVAQRAATPAPATGRRGVRRGAQAGAVLATAGAVAVLPSLFTGTATPAFAVERNDDGSISVWMREYTQPHKLLDRLRDLGVNAVVDFVPADKHCSTPRADFAAPDPLLWTSMPPRDGRSGYMRLRPDRIAPGRTLVMEVYYRNDAGGHVEGDLVRVATGPVAACVLQPGGAEISFTETPATAPA